MQTGAVSQPAHRFVVHVAKENHALRASHLGFEQRSVHQRLAQAFAACARVDHDGDFGAIAHVGQLQQTNELRTAIESAKEHRVGPGEPCSIGTDRLVSHGSAEAMIAVACEKAQEEGKQQLDIFLK